MNKMCDKCAEYKDNQCTNIVDGEVGVCWFKDTNEYYTDRIVSDIIECDDVIRVIYSDKSVEEYDCNSIVGDWFKMTNDAFFKKYGYNYVPSESMKDKYLQSIGQLIPNNISNLSGFRNLT